MHFLCIEGIHFYSLGFTRIPLSAFTSMPLSSSRTLSMSASVMSIA